MKSLSKTLRFLKAKAGFDHFEKQLGHQSALSYLALSEILPFDEESVRVAKKRILKEFEIPNFATAVHKNDMMFHYRLYNHKGDLHQSLYSYYWVGANLMQNLKKLTDEYKLPAAKVLDFGAGHGRTSRFWPAFFETSEVTVSELKETALDFQKEQFGFKAIEHASDPASFPVQSFDLILAVSVFTHLPKARFETWLHRLCNSLNPGGALIFTFNNPEENANKRLLGKKPSADFYYHKNSEDLLFPFIADSNTKPEEYGHAFVSEELLGKSAEELGMRVRFLKNLLTKNQEAVVFIKDRG